MKLCNAPFCKNPKYIHQGKSKGWCLEHICERIKFKVRSYKELLPLWAFKRCQVHGLLNFDQCYIHKNPGKTDRFICKYCTKSYINSRYCPEKEKIRNAKKASQNRNRELKCKYGITLPEYNAILQSQNNSCAICKTRSLSSKRKSFDVDHCHKTKQIRGLLCHSCNVGIGFFQDNIELLKQAISYLSQPPITK